MAALAQESCTSALQRLLSKSYASQADSSLVIGSKARFEFSKSPPIEGRIVGRETSNQVVVLDEKTGTLQTVLLSGESAPQKVQKLANAPDFEPYQVLSPHGANLGKMGATGLVKVSVNGPAPRTYYLYGRVRHLGDGLYEIDALNGTRHHVDTHFARVWFQRDLSVKAAAPRPWSKRTAQTVSILDPLKKERLQWATKIANAKKSPLKNPEYYSFLDKHLDDTRALVTRWYGPKADVMLRWVEKALGQRFIPLLTDPGLANHFDRFQAFAPRFLSKKPRASLLELRQAFSDSLGKTKVFRGMVLSAPEFRTVKKDGISSRLFLTQERSKAFSEYMTPLSFEDDAIYPRSPMEAIEKKYSSYNPGQEAVQVNISTTAYPEIAETIGYHGGAHDWEEMHKQKKSMYVFELEMPELDLVRNRGLFGANDENPVVPIVINEKVFNMSDYRIEYFTPFWIEPQTIQKIRVLKEEPTAALNPFTPEGIKRYTELYHQQQKSSSKPGAKSKPGR
jgi:hypothetical protein